MISWQPRTPQPGVVAVGLDQQGQAGTLFSKHNHIAMFPEILATEEDERRSRRLGHNISCVYEYRK